jgi:hypothetical protein
MLEERHLQGYWHRTSTMNMSLGTLGRTELLPEQPVLELCTIRGHTMVSAKLVDLVVDRVRNGLMTTEEAAMELIQHGES